MAVQDVIEMSLKVMEMTASELRSLVSETVREALEDSMEDILALTSQCCLQSIEEARKDRREGRLCTFEEVFHA